MESDGSCSSIQPSKPGESGWLSVTVRYAAASAGWSAGRTAQALAAIVNEPNAADPPTLIVKAAVTALTLSSAWSLTVVAGSQPLGRSTVAGGATPSGG